MHKSEAGTASAVCERGATIETVEVARNYYRYSERSADVRKCENRYACRPDDHNVLRSDAGGGGGSASGIGAGGNLSGTNSSSSVFVVSLCTDGGYSEYCTEGYCGPLCR